VSLLPDGLVVVDKPPGLTSHDVVGRVRRLAGTRRVGHAGTLDPMATGVLVIGVERATRLLGHLALTEKAYVATVRLGASTVSDDAEGEVVSTADASAVPESAIAAEVAALTGEILQVPSRVSALKVAGRRAHERVRDGEAVELAARPVTVHRFEVVAVHREGSHVDLEVEVDCSSGTYVRALARDLGAALGVGGHLTVLRRTRVGPYDLSSARTLDELAEELTVLPLADAAAAAFPCHEVGEETARRLRHGVPIPRTGMGEGPVAVFGPGGDFLALVQDRGPRAKPLAVFRTD
jgi:tRNA pseudouridine55 synthase